MSLVVRTTEGDFGLSMKTNIFLNSYQQPENKLTYSFLSVLEYLNSKEVFEFLLSDTVRLADSPLVDVRTVYGGSERNPDGSFELKDSKNEVFRVLLEVKTHRRQLDTEQLLGHLTNHAKQNDVVLFISTKRSEMPIVNNLRTGKFFGKTWGEIARFLMSRVADPIAIQFVRYGKMSEEFLEDPEISKEELRAYEVFSGRNVSGKITRLFRNFLQNEKLLRMFGSEIQLQYHNDWGREGVQVDFQKGYGPLGAWYFFGLYYDESDHGIAFKKEGVPEIAFFIDIDEMRHKSAVGDRELASEIIKLEQFGFESNLNGTMTDNLWRFLYYRIPISDVGELTEDSLLAILNSIFSKIKASESPRVKALLFSKIAF